MSTELLQALAAESGIVSAVGAGGKKTTLYRLLRAHGGRVGVTATSFINVFPAELKTETVIAPSAQLTERVPLTTGQRIAYAQPSSKTGRLTGIEPDLVAPIHRRGNFDLTLVKADGARMRRIKCPEAHEPNIPAGTDTVLLILSALALGRPLDEKVAHRPERVAAVTGRALGDILRPQDLAAIFSHPHGLLKGSDGCRVIPVLNMVDTPALHDSGRDIAERALAASDRFDRIVLTSDQKPDYLVDVIFR